jgi:hypothetical protein
VNTAATLGYGLHDAWRTPIRCVNLLEEGGVDGALHDWLERYADDPALASGPLAHQPRERLSNRYNLAVFAPPATPELARIKQLLVARADAYVRETIEDPLPEHEKLAYFWFVVQRPNNLDEMVSPHYHEPGDVALVYYLSAPANDSGQLVLLDPRGTIERGGRALPRHRSSIHYQPRRGDLILFPRYLMHYTTVNTDARARKVIGGVVAYDLPGSIKNQYRL